MEDTALRNLVLIQMNAKLELMRKQKVSQENALKIGNGVLPWERPINIAESTSDFTWGVAAGHFLAVIEYLGDEGELLSKFYYYIWYSSEKLLNPRMGLLMDLVYDYTDQSIIDVAKQVAREKLNRISAAEKLMVPIVRFS